MRLRTVLTILSHRVTWRFLAVIAGAIGMVSITDDLNTLQTLVCSLVSCTD